MKRFTKMGVLAAAGAVGLSLAVPMSAAHADVAAGPGDIVGVGSDTAQYALDFFADGDTVGDAGWNSTNTGHRIVNFDASGDASGGATTGVTSVLRAGSKPITRPNGSGGGITAFLADNGPTKTINYVRSSRLPTKAEQDQATAQWGGMRVIQFATDSLQIATAASTNAPAGLSINDLVNIYDGTYLKWSDVPNYSGPAAGDTIIPTIPQAGSGTRNFFTADMQDAWIAMGNTGTMPLSNPNLQTVQEHDPKGITGQTNPADAIGAFSVGRVSLINGGYFGAAVQNTIKLLTGASPAGGASYNKSRGLYILIRESDIASTTPFLPTSPKNWANTLFVGTGNRMASPLSKNGVQAAGVTWGYSDLADAHTTP
jgi:ABC-type phosphate transport system substrate-binding protein